MRRYWRTLTLGVVGLASAVVAYRAIADVRFRSDLAEARRAQDGGRLAQARSRLLGLVERRPGEAETLYRLGVVESELGNLAGARAAWTRVPSGSPFAGRAAVELARKELEHHRLAAAEVLMPRALEDEGPHAIEAFETLVNLYKTEGRYREALRLARAWAGRFPDPINLLKEIAVLGSTNPYKLDLVRGGLERASRAAPDDDRVWLGWANLATRTGQFETADRWLDRSERRRPDDAAVVRARLDLAVASEDVAGAWGALGRLPTSAVGPAEILGLRAWFAAHSGNDVAERRALAGRLAMEPDHLPSVERLAELEQQAGRPDEAARLRVRKAGLDRAMSRYQALLFEPDAASRASELARLAESLGRPLEARTLWDLAARRAPGDPEPARALARLQATPPPVPPADATLAALLAGRTTARPVTPKDEAKASDRPGGAEPSFVDDAEAAGLRFTFDNGIDPLRHLPETMSGGVGVLDYDGDGWLDVFCVQGGAFLPDPARPTGGDRLFRNRGDGTFEDATDRAGLAAMRRGYGHGVAVGDHDGDGRPDLFVTRWDAYALYRNRGDGTFEDATDRAGLGGPRDWPTSAAFADLDGDGDLDLYVCHYLEWDVANPQICRDPRSAAPAFCGPPRFRARPDHLFRNDGGRFVDVTNEAGIVDTDGRGLGVVACDFDADGRVDLFVSNDQSANFLFRNRGGMKFEEVGEFSGVASSAEGQYKANMGIACGDHDGDGLPDLAVTEFYNEGTTLYRNLGGGAFADHSSTTGLQLATRHRLGFGAAFLDFDANGILDLATTNGHVDDFRPAVPYRMPAQLLAGTPRGRFVDVTAGAGPAWQIPRLGRGLASADLDNDGRVDLLVLAQNQPLAFFHNRTRGGRWLTLRLEGTASNRDAVGARVSVTAGGRTRTAWRFGGGSYQSASDTRLHFGLGRAERAERVEVTWPSGRSERFDDLTADAGYLLREGAGQPAPLAGFGR